MNVREAQVLKNRFGSVKPYTRHLSSCPYSVEDPECNDCTCPKWLYERRNGGERRRYSLVTPSWTEAGEKATEVLRGFDPEIEAARRMAVQAPRKKTSLLDAVSLPLDDRGAEAEIRACDVRYRGIEKKATQLFADFALLNLFMARKTVLHGSVA